MEALYLDLEDLKQSNSTMGGGGGGEGESLRYSLHKEPHGYVSTPLELNPILGPQCQAESRGVIKNLIGTIISFACMGLWELNCTFSSTEPGTPVTTKPVNLLADLVPRFDLEQEKLLSWLHSEEVKSAEGQGQKLRELTSLEMERFSVGVDGDYEAGLIGVGLLERIRTIPGGRCVFFRE